MQQPKHPIFQIFVSDAMKKLCQEESAKCENEPIISPFKMS